MKTIKNYQTITTLNRCKKHLKGAHATIKVNPYDSTITTKTYTNERAYLNITYYDNKVVGYFMSMNDHDNTTIIK